MSDAKITLPVSILLIFCLQNAPLTQLSVPSSSTSTSKHCKTMTPTAFPALSRIVPADADLMLLTNKKVNSGIVHNIHPFPVPQLESRFSLRCQWHHAAVNSQVASIFCNIIISDHVGCYAAAKPSAEMQLVLHLCKKSQEFSLAYTSSRCGALQ